MYYNIILRVENITLATTENPQLILLVIAELHEVSNILQNHYITTETKDHVLCTILCVRSVNIQSDRKRRLRACEMNYSDVCYKSLT